MALITSKLISRKLALYKERVEQELGRFYKLGSEDLSHSAFKPRLIVFSLIKETRDGEFRRTCVRLLKIWTAQMFRKMTAPENFKSSQDKT